MSEFLATVFSPAMLPFTALLLLVIAYWLLMLVGAIGLDFLNVDGLGEGIDGVADGAADGVLDGLSGASHGALSSLLSFLNIGTVPITIVASLTILQMWGLAFLYFVYIAEAFKGFAPAFLVVGVGVGLVVMVGVLLTGLTTRPFRDLFRVQTRHGRQHLIGKVCTIQTTMVCETFGQAEVKTSGAPLVLTVYCEDENTLSRGDEAVIVGFDESNGRYHVKPMI